MIPRILMTVCIQPALIRMCKDVFIFAKTGWPMGIDTSMMVHGPTCFVLLLVDKPVRS